MTQPNAGDFQVVGNEDGGVQLVCPIDGDYIQVDAWGFATIREIIGAASEHARLAHALSVVR